MSSHIVFPFTPWYCIRSSIRYRSSSGTQSLNCIVSSGLLCEALWARLLFALGRCLPAFLLTRNALSRPVCASLYAEWEGLPRDDPIGSATMLLICCGKGASEGTAGGSCDSGVRIVISGWC